MAAGGVHPKIAQALARQWTITLTMHRYSHSVPGELAAELNALPDFAAPQNTAVHRAATGEGGIRTPEALAGLAVFKTAAFSRSATSPGTVLG